MAHAPEPPAFTLVNAQASDFEALLALRSEAMRESLERLGRFDPERVRQRFLASFAPEATRHVLVFGEPVGFFTLKTAANGLLLDHLYVHPRHQGRGLGSALLGLVFDEADAAGLELRVGALRGSASNRFYTRHGFTQVGESEWDIYYARAARPLVPPEPA